jgi:hypothetical protein
MPPNSILLDIPIQIPSEFKIIIGAGIALIILFSILSRIRGKPRSDDFPPEFPRATYQLCPTLLSRGELAFLLTLERAVANQFRIAMKVRLGDLVQVPGYDSESVSARNKTQQKHIDFVLCSVGEVQPMLAIELDDATHARPDRQSRDSFVDACLRSAGLPILRVPCQATYDPRKLTTAIQNALLRR